VNSESSSVVPLQQANLCLDCDAISAAHTRCLVCGSQALLSIARALSRPNYPSFVDPSRGMVNGGSPRRAGNFLHST
jgi:hypothetical protein